MNKEVKDITGKKYGKLFIVSYSHVNNKGHAVWNCLCDCGNEAKIIGSYMRAGFTKSCGCYQKEEMSKRTKKHGQSGKNPTKEYAAWANIIARCENPNHKYYKDYGGRGISVCKEWKDFESFLADMGIAPSKRHTLERIDNDANYCKSNCRWDTQKQQCNNRRNNILIHYNQQSFTLTQWCEKMSIDYHKIWHLIKRKNKSFAESLNILNVKYSE